MPTETPSIEPVILADGRRWPEDFPATNEAGEDGRTWWERERANDAVIEIRRRATRHAAIAALPRNQRRRVLRQDFERCKGKNEFDLAAFTYWCGNYGWVRAEKESSTGSPFYSDFPPLVRDMPFMLWESQQQAAAWFFEKLRRKQDGLVPKSREVGITWLVLHIIVWLWTFHGGNYLLGSRKDELVDKVGDMRSLFERCRYILDRQPPHLRPHFTSKNKNLQRTDDREAQINGESTNANFARSGRYRLVLVDEYGAIDPAIARAIMRSITSAGPVWIVYNPAGEMHPSYKLFSQWKAEQILQLRWPADPYRPPNFFEMQLLENGGKLTREEAAREWDCSHRDVSEGLIFEWRDAIEYDDDSPEWKARVHDARTRWIQIGGWDFGTGLSYTVCVICLLEIHADESVTLWFDDSRFWSQQAHDVISAEALAMIRTASPPSPIPGGPPFYFHVADPTGINRMADQGNWISYLRDAGINVEQLEHSFNTFEAQDWVIINIRQMLARGRIRVHRERCQPLIQSIKAWRRRVPPGRTALEVNGRVAPMKDGPSHGCNAMMYAVDGVVKHLRGIAEERAMQPAANYAGPGAEEVAQSTLASFFAERPLGGFWQSIGGYRNAA